MLYQIIGHRPYYVALTYIGLNFFPAFFLAKMKWFPDRLIVFLELVINLYVVIWLGCFFKNAVTSVYVKLPSAETRQNITFECMSKLIMIEWRK